MNKERVNKDVTELKNALVRHIGSSTFSNAVYNPPTKLNRNPINDYISAVLLGLGLPSAEKCDGSASPDLGPIDLDDVGELSALSAPSASSSSSASSVPDVAELSAPSVPAAAAASGVSSAPSASSSSSASSGSGMDGGQAGGTLVLVNMAWVIKEILIKSYRNADYLVHNGKQVLRVSCSEELAKRFCAPIYMNYIGIKIDSVCEAMTLDTYKHIPGRLEDSYISSLELTSAKAKAAFKEWDERVKSILDGLASAGLPSTVATFPNLLTKPVVQSVTVLSGVNPIVRDAVYAANAPGAITRMVQPQIFTVGYAKPVMTAMRGGAEHNPHAPLYPKLVMNGGANPFALYGGNEAVDTMVSVIQNRINALKTEYLAVSGVPLAGSIDTKIQTYVTKVKSGFEGLEEDLKNLRDANGYLAQYPLSEGLPRPANTASLKTLADKGREVTEKSLRLSKQVGKLSEIENLLNELVANARPKKISY